MGIISVLVISLCLLSHFSCAQLFCYSIDYSPPGSSVHGILQTRILEWVAMPFSKGSSQPRDGTWVSCIVGRFFTVWTTREAKSQLKVQEPTVRSDAPKKHPSFQSLAWISRDVTHSFQNPKYFLGASADLASLKLQLIEAKSFLASKRGLRGRKLIAHQAQWILRTGKGWCSSGPG